MEQHITYRHLKDDNNIPYATLALLYNKDEKTAYFTASLCGRADNFSYKRGREIAIYRMSALIIPESKKPKQLAKIVEKITFEEAKNLLHALKIYGMYKSGFSKPTYVLSVLSPTSIDVK